MSLISLEQEIVSSNSPEELRGEQSRRVEEALRVVRSVSKQVGNEIPVMELPEDINQLDTTPGIYLTGARETDTAVTGARFEFVQRNLSGAADSAHAAIPGNLVIESPAGDSEITVVAKCFTKREADDRLIRIKQEVATMIAMKQRGALTIDPIAVAMAKTGGEQHMILLSRYNPTLTTMDNLQWGRGLSDPTNIESAILGARALGAFDAMGFRHGDAKIKNVAQDETGRLGMIDYETTRPFDVTSEWWVNDTVFADYSLYLSSLIKKGFFGYREQDVAAASIREVLDMMSLEYVEQWANAPKPIQTAVWDGMKSSIDNVMPGVRKHQGYYSR